MRQRPKIFLDIRSSKGFDSFSSREQRLNLSFKPSNKFVWRLPGTFTSVMIFIFAFYFSTSALAPIITNDTHAEANATQQDEQQILKDQLQAYEQEIADLESKITEANKKGSSLQGEISKLNTKVNQINLKIKAVNLSISKLNAEVKETTNKITNKESDILSNKENLGNTLQAIYKSDRTDTVELLLKSKKISDFFTSVNNLNTFQDNLRGELQDLVVARDELVDARTQLDLQKADNEAIRVYQASQSELIRQAKVEKNNLLVVTKGEASKFKDQVVEKKKLAAEIRNRIFRLLGGGELEFGEAVKIAKVAEKATGVRAALILSILNQESGVSGIIGKNLGKCYYNTPKNNDSGTVMSNKQKPAFLALLAELGPDYNPNTTPVSCPIVSDGQYGGAMGPSQFMPNTWDLYKDRVSKLTGGVPANPFINLDAFTATALYIKDGLVGCKNTYTDLFRREACAAAKYYAGGNWRNFMSTGRYGYRVADRAGDLQKDIDLLDESGAVSTR